MHNLYTFELKFLLRFQVFFHSNISYTLFIPRNCRRNPPIRIVSLFGLKFWKRNCGFSFFLTCFFTLQERPWRFLSGCTTVPNPIMNALLLAHIGKNCPRFSLVGSFYLDVAPIRL